MYSLTYLLHGAGYCGGYNSCMLETENVRGNFVEGGKC